eukprot:TRINITY_DN19393_c0_g1_i1.p1 TRINITY_DN19393_c0_g1~~TRINITY_DN19393_c0_g1_i1.p1  ORF type:complete len:147 (+),score=10.35 TRINITY_DN19393_c0_g1_i1:1294-1734(+)
MQIEFIALHATVNNPWRHGVQFQRDHLVFDLYILKKRLETRGCCPRLIMENAQKAYGATHVAHKFKSLPHPPEKNPYSITPETLSSYLSLTPNSGMGIQPGVSLTLHSLSDSGNFITFLFFFQRMHFSLPLHCYSRVREGSCLCGV